MPIKSRRKAREAALRALYEIEVGHTVASAAIKSALAEAGLDEERAAYAAKLVNGVRANLEKLDDPLAARIRDYSFDRLAAVDRNLLRLAAYELFFVPAVPPAVTIDEAIELAKRYSTAESGRFVNGVLAALLRESPKANWDPAAAPVEFEAPAPEEPRAEPEPEEVLEAESEEAKRLLRVGGWTLRADPAAEPTPPEAGAST